MTAPRWFLKDLEIIDPTYFPIWNEKMGYWEMKKKMDIHYARGRHDYHVVDPTIGVFKELNNNALDNIRYRKQLSLNYPGASYLTWILDGVKELKAKRNELAVELATEGFMRIFKQGKSQQFDMSVPDKT